MFVVGLLVLAAACDDSSATSTVSCRSNVVEGVLEPLGREGIGIFEGSRHLEVDWPDGYSALSVGGRLSVVDASGDVLAHVGETVRLAGGEARPGVWIACGTPILTVIAAS